MRRASPAMPRRRPCGFSATRGGCAPSAIPVTGGGSATAWPMTPSTASCISWAHATTDGSARRGRAPKPSHLPTQGGGAGGLWSGLCPEDVAARPGGPAASVHDDRGHAREVQVVDRAGGGLLGLVEGVVDPVLDALRGVGVAGDGGGSATERERTAGGAARGCEAGQRGTGRGDRPGRADRAEYRGGGRPERGEDADDE